MADDFENQITPEEFDFEAELQRDRVRQAPTGNIPGSTEKTGPDLNIIELILVLFLALNADFGVGWLGGKLAAGIAVIPMVGAALSAVILFLAKFATICVAAILWLWCLLRFKKLPWKRLGGATFIEVIPFIGELAPCWTAFVLSIIIQQKIMPIIAKYSAAAKKIEKTVEKIEKAAQKIGGAAAKIAAKL